VRRALLRAHPFSWTNRATFSITTIASSTTSPVASVSPKSVSILIENPNSFISANVPTSEIGIVMSGPGAASAAPSTLVSSGSITIPSTPAMSSYTYPIEIAVDPLLNLYAATKDSIAYTTPASLTPSWMSTAAVSYFVTGVATVP
jgi:hypothetical protein